MWPSKIKTDVEKSKTCYFDSGKWIWPSIFAQDVEAGKRHNRV
jgi:hypothetical protein